MGPIAELEAELVQTRIRLDMAEQEIERLRGSFRGLIWQLTKRVMGCLDVALAIAEHALKNSLLKYPHPIAGAPKDPGMVRE